MQLRWEAAPDADPGKIMPLHEANISVAALTGGKAQTKRRDRFSPARIMPINVRVHAAKATQTKASATGVSSKKLASCASRQLAAVYMPSGNTMAQLSSR